MEGLIAFQLHFDRMLTFALLVLFASHDHIVSYAVFTTFVRILRQQIFWGFFYFLSGCLEEIAFEALFLSDLKGSTFEKHAKFINGLETFKVQVKQHIPVADSSVRL